jgi:hypothetical protein
MNDLIDKLGLVNPVDFTRIFVHPSTRSMLDRLCSRISQLEGVEYIHIEGCKIKIVKNRHMPENRAFFGGVVLNLEDFVGV